MSAQSGSSHLRVLFEAALRDYKQQTGIELAEHPLAKRLQYSNSAESVTVILREQAQDFREFREKDRVFKPLKKVLTVLHRLPSTAGLAQDVGLHFPPVKAIHTALGILLSAANGPGVIDDYSALADFLESIGHFLNRLEIYSEIPPTEAMNEMIVKILVELLSTLALTTKETKQGKLKKLVRKLSGEKKMEAMVQRLDRLTQDEARQTVPQILKVVHGLVENMKVVVDDGEVSVDHLKKTLEIMHRVASDLNKAKRDSLQKDLFGWLSPPDPWKNHHAACISRHRGTAEWFIQGNTFSEWRTSEVPGSLLWVHGKPGAGKSVLCSTIIEDIRAMQEAGLASLAFFYCDFREDRKKELRGLLSSFLVQLFKQSDSYFDLLSKFYSEHDEGSRPPSDDALAGCLMDLLNLPGLAPVYLIVDALDGCPNQSVFPSPRAKVLSLIKELVETQIRNLRMCVTSRPEFDIKDVLNPLIFCSVSLHDESGQKRDIEDYIKSLINMRTIRRWKEEHRKLAIDDVIKNSNGMFRWVGCQVDHICDCVPARLPQALAELPKTLDETYERTLGGINEANWEFAHRMFQFVSVASRPLHVKELADLLAFDFEAGSIPKFHKDWRLEDPVDAVLSTCSTLLAIVNDQGSPVIQFSHFSVKEFLTSTHLAKATDIISRRYHVSMTPAHTLVAQASLGILLSLDKDVTRDSLEDFPFAEYAAEHWVDHAQFKDVSRHVEDGLRRLFDPNKPHLAICVWIHDPVVSTWERMIRHETPLPLP
ncbi:hypothetical protein V8E52_010703 [Russula decolorans]